MKDASGDDTRGAVPRGSGSVGTERRSRGRASSEGSDSDRENTDGNGQNRSSGSGGQGGHGRDDEEDDPDSDEEAGPEEADPEEEEQEDDDDEEEVAEGSVVGAEGSAAGSDQRVESSVAGSPVAGGSVTHQGNWFSSEEILQETYPVKSKVTYLSAYKNFVQFLKNENQFVPDTMPTETMVLNYFHYLKRVRFWAPTTIWSTYSRLNAVFKRTFRFSMKSLPTVTDLLKSFETGHRIKKSSVFSPQQVRHYLKLVFIRFLLVV